MKPVKGKYIFQSPRNSQFQLTYELDSLWHKFKCINLEINHRQGEDKTYADTLNRIRIGEETIDDINILKEKVRKQDHKDIKKEKDAIYIFGTNYKVNQINSKRLKAIKGPEYIVPAIKIHKAK